jgi:hypothetical protein
MDFSCPGMAIFDADFAADIGLAGDHENPGKVSVRPDSSSRGSARNEMETIPLDCGPDMA